MPARVPVRVVGRMYRRRRRGLQDPRQQDSSGARPNPLRGGDRPATPVGTSAGEPPDERWLSENRTADGFRGDMIEAGAIPRDDCAAGMLLSPV